MLFACHHYLKKQKRSKLVNSVHLKGPEFLCKHFHMYWNTYQHQQVLQIGSRFFPDTKTHSSNNWQPNTKHATSLSSHIGSASMIVCLLSTPLSSSPYSVSTSSGTSQPSLSSCSSSSVTSFLQMAKLWSTQQVAMMRLALFVLLTSKNCKLRNQPLRWPMPLLTTLRMDECTLLYIFCLLVREPSSLKGLSKYDFVG